MNSKPVPRGRRNKSAESLHRQQVHPRNQAGNKDYFSSHTQGWEKKKKSSYQWVIEWHPLKTIKQNPLTLTERGKKTSKGNPNNSTRNWAEFLRSTTALEPSCRLPAQFRDTFLHRGACYRWCLVILTLRRQLIMQNKSVPRNSHIISSYGWMRFQSKQHRPKKKIPTAKKPHSSNEENHILHNIGE